MPDSDELDDILEQIKSMKNQMPKDNDEKPEFKLDSKLENPIKIQEKPLPDKPKQTANLDSVRLDDFNNKRTSASKPKNTKGEKPMANKKEFKLDKKKFTIFAAVVIVAIALIAIIAAVTQNKDASEPTTQKIETTVEQPTEAPVSKTNPLTGESDFNPEAVGKRPIACVVENASAARPQWGINDSDNPPDIIVEGEVEGGETRMLFMYADYTAVPKQIGPMRSARPPYIKFAELFDSIFIHWGQSQTKKGTAYIGANTVFRVDKVDHINQMTYSGVQLFGRDGSRGVSTEHTGVLYGDKIAEAIKGEGFRTDAKDSNYTKFNFAQEQSKVSDTDCSNLNLTFSSRTGTREWTFSDEDKMYHCSDYRTDVARTNLLVLFDTTEYISKANYKNSGSSEIYCNYNLDGGKGKLATNGTVVDITWKVENGVIVIKDANGADVNFNVGTTWIGYASSNNGGAVTAE